MIVHGNRHSPFVRKVLVVLEEKGVTYDERDLVPVPKTPELLAKHPLGKIPVLELGNGTFVPDSSVICLYLERVHPARPVYPADPEQYARALFVEEFSDTKLMDTIGGMVFERFVKPTFFGQATDEARVQTILRDELPPAFDWLESQVHPERDTILPQFSVADAALGAQLASLGAAGERIDARRWPRLSRYVEALWARPAFVRSAPR